MDGHRNNGFLNFLTIVFHIIAAIQFSYSVYYDWMFVVVPKDIFPIMSAFGGKFKFLTFWDAVSK